MRDPNLVVPYKNEETGKKEQISRMFNTIAPRYDLLNRVLSFGIDVYWRKKAIRLLKPEQPKRILDIATGTADFAIEALRLNPEQVIGVDISEGMLAMGREKLRKKGLDKQIELRMGDSEKLLFPDNSFDAVIVSFGVRNFENLERGLADMQRVTRPGGMCVILEFSKPYGFPFKQLYRFYSGYILPFIGRLVSKDASAYTYLPESAKVFPDGKSFTDILEKVGFTQTRCLPLASGICSIYTGKKAE